MEPKSAPTDASAKVFNYLLNVDLSDFDPTTSPYMTPAELDLIDRSDADYVQELRELESQGSGPFDGDALSLKHVKTYLNHQGINFGRNGVKDAIESMGYTEYRGAKKIDGKVVPTPRFFSKAQLGNAGEQYDDYYDEEKEMRAKLKI
tara:strand:+ start:259 stop:702 length:444 start_codon:yes stop_codon:yes gene_type:complete